MYACHAPLCADLRRPGHLDVVAADQLRHHQPAFEQDVEAGCGFAFGVDLPWFDMNGVSVFAEPLELLVVELFEQEQRP